MAPDRRERKRKLYPTTPDGQPLLTNWTDNRSLESFAQQEES